MTGGRRSLQVGVLLPTREFAVAGRDDARTLIELATLAESLGFDSAWVGDSPVARPRFEPLSLLAAIAARTERITLGTAVLLAALRPPVLLAHAAASLDRLAEGRLILGLGAGFPIPSTEAEFAAVGVPFKERIGRLEETVAICRALWANTEDERTTASFAGRYWRFDELSLRPRPVSTDGPPLWLGGAGEKASERVGRLFDGWLPYSPTSEQFAAGLARIRQAAGSAGRSREDIAPGLYVTVNLQADTARAERELAGYTQGYYGMPLQGMRELQAFHAGDASACAEWLRDYVQAGAAHVVLRFGTLDDPGPMMRHAAESLLPALRCGDARARMRKRTTCLGTAAANASTGKRASGH
jgi:probable F420-dependent oxidoreductase